MHKHSQRIQAANCLVEASWFLLEAAERLHDLQRFDQSLELLDLGVQLREIALHELELDPKPTPFTSQLIKALKNGANGSSAGVGSPARR